MNECLNERAVKPVSVPPPRFAAIMVCGTLALSGFAFGQAAKLASPRSLAQGKSFSQGKTPTPGKSSSRPRKTLESERIDPNLDPNLEALADTERAFARLGAEKGVRESFLAYFADDGIWFVPDPKRTVEDLRSRPAPTSPPQRRLEWAPVYGDVSRAGDLGYDTGPSANSDLSAKREPTRYGYFFSIWKKQPNGDWRVALDLGTQTPDVWDPAKRPEFHAAPPSGWMPKGKPGGKLEAEKGFASLQAAESSFSQAAHLRGLATAAPQFLDDAVRLHRNGMSPVIGSRNVLAYFAGNDSKAHWEPIESFVATSADLGYTYGRYSSVGVAQNGVEETGYYVHVWRKDSRGNWKLVFDVNSPTRPEKK